MQRVGVIAYTSHLFPMRSVIRGVARALQGAPLNADARAVAGPANAADDADNAGNRQTESSVVKKIIETNETTTQAFLTFIRTKTDNDKNALRDRIADERAAIQEADFYVGSDIRNLLLLHARITEFIANKAAPTPEDYGAEARRRSSVNVRRMFMIDRAPISTEVSAQSVWSEIRLSASKKNRGPSVYFSVKTALWIAAGIHNSKGAIAIIRGFDPSAYLLVDNASNLSRLFLLSFDANALETRTLNAITFFPEKFSEIYLLLTYLLINSKTSEEKNDRMDALYFLEDNYPDEVRKALQILAPRYSDAFVTVYLDERPQRAVCARTLFDKYQHSARLDLPRFLYIAYQQNSTAFALFYWGCTLSDDVYNTKNADFRSALLRHDLELVQPLILARDSLLVKLDDLRANRPDNPPRYAEAVNTLADLITRLRDLDTNICIWDTVYDIAAGGAVGAPMLINSADITALIQYAERILAYFHSKLYKESHV